MKKITLSILSLLLVAAGTIKATAQSVDEIVQKNITAMGGSENWKKVKTIKTTGAVTAQGMEIPVIICIKDHKGMRMEFTVSGMTGYSILTDKEGWNYMPFGGQTKPEALSADDVKKGQDGLDIMGSYTLADYKAKGNKITYLGKDDVEGTECYKLKVVYPSGKEETRYYDASTYYHIRSVAKVTVNGKEIEATSNFSNYKKLPEGIFYPMSIESSGGPITVKSVEINKGIEESAFTPKS